MWRYTIVGMKPYWAKIERRAGSDFFNFGVGVTARSEDDARAILAAAFSGVLVESIEVIDEVQSLDPFHVVPNMGNIFGRGIWFPRGFESIAAEVR